MATKGDVLKACSEMRPTIKRYLQEFGVNCNKDERLRARELSDSVSDYDPAGKFSYMMYAAMLAAGDDDLDDLSVYNYFLSSMGEFMDMELEQAFIDFLDTIYEVSKDELKAKDEVTDIVDRTGEKFSNYIIRHLRTAFMDSDMFKHIIDKMESETQEKMLMMLATNPTIATSMLRILHAGLTRLIKSLNRWDANKVLERIDEEIPEDGDAGVKAMLLKISAGDLPPQIYDLLKMLSMLRGDHISNNHALEEILKDVIEDVQDKVQNFAPEVSKGMVYLRRSTLMMTGLYIMIASGELGEVGNRNLAYQMRDLVNTSMARGEMSGTDVLKLEKMTTTENPILVN